VFLGDLRQAHAGTTVSDHLLPIHVQTRSPDLPAFRTGAGHPTAYSLYKKRSFHLAEHCDDVLMYLAPRDVRTIGRGFYRCLREGDWLVVSGQ
jgi:hypothetical protein